MELMHAIRWQRLRELLVQMLEARANRYRYSTRRAHQTEKTPSAQ